jgi:hypothetical protein
MWCRRCPGVKGDADRDGGSVEPSFAHRDGDGADTAPDSFRDLRGVAKVC